MTKPSIRRRRTPTGSYAPGWDVTRPGFGFASSSSITTYPTWREAHCSLSAPATGAQLAQRCDDHYHPGMRSWQGGWSRRPRWIDAREGA